MERPRCNWRHDAVNIIGINDYVIVNETAFFIQPMMDRLPQSWYKKLSDVGTLDAYVFDIPIKDTIQQWADAGGYAGLHLDEFILKIYGSATIPK